MKKLVIIIIVLSFYGCVGTYKQASFVSNKAYIGMPLEEFRKTAGKKAKIEAMEAGYTVYRMSDYDTWTGALIDTKFFYFSSEAKLYKIDGGEFKQNRYQIQILK
ncbi:MAG: hypothetical protein V4557_14805 [Bacteroidota bacterium]